MEGVIVCGREESWNGSSEEGWDIHVAGLSHGKTSFCCYCRHKCILVSLDAVLKGENQVK